MKFRNMFGAAAGLVTGTVALSGTAFATPGDFNFQSSIVDSITGAHPAGVTTITTNPNVINSVSPATTNINFVNGSNNTVLSPEVAPSAVGLGTFTSNSTDSVLQNFNGFFTESITVSDVTANTNQTQSIVGRFTGSLDNSSGTVSESFSNSSLTFTFSDGTYVFSNFGPATIGAPGGTSTASTALVTFFATGTSAPEPSALALVIPGVLGMVGFARRRKVSK